jgi:hypothetical protein
MIEPTDDGERTNSLGLFNTAVAILSKQFTKQFTKC